ncbi:hypothetical protein [Crossiella sp. NPDC003009]
MAEAVVRWLTANQGGRRSGPPTAVVYRSTASFAPGPNDLGEARPATVPATVLLQEVEELPDGRRRCLVGFIAPELVQPHLRAGARMLVLEGPRTVAVAEIVLVPGPKNE